MDQQGGPVADSLEVADLEQKQERGFALPVAVFALVIVGMISMDAPSLEQPAYQHRPAFRDQGRPAAGDEPSSTQPPEGLQAPICEVRHSALHPDCIPQTG